MRSCRVEEAFILVQHVLQMRRIQIDQPVETFLAHRTHPTFSISIRPRRSNGRMDSSNAFGGENSIKDSTIFAVVVTYHMGKRLLLRLQVPDDLARLLRHPSLCRMSRNAGNMNPPG